MDSVKALTAPLPGCRFSPGGTTINGNPVNLIGTGFGKLLRQLREPGAALPTTATGGTLVKERPGEIGQYGNTMSHASGALDV
jgi:hypothetical protein